MICGTITVGLRAVLFTFIIVFLAAAFLHVCRLLGKFQAATREKTTAFTVDWSVKGLDERFLLAFVSALVDFKVGACVCGLGSVLNSHKT